MIRVIDLGDNSEREATAKALQSLEFEHVWFELVDPSVEELEAVAEKTAIPTDLLRLPEVSNFINLRLEPEYGLMNFVVVHDILESKDIRPIVIAFSKNFLVTVVKGNEQHVVGMVKARLNKARVDPPALVAYYLLDEIVSDHFAHLEKIEELTATMEEEILEKPQQATLRRVFKLKSRLVSFNKILWYERGLIFNLKRSEIDCLPAKARNLFDTAHEYLTRQIDIVETYREILSDAINAYLSTVSNRINASIRSLTFVMFYLTIITTITSFPNTVATFFGISQFGTTDYRIIYLAMILSIVLPFLWLWKRKWLKL